MRVGIAPRHTIGVVLYMCVLPCLSHLPMPVLSTRSVDIHHEDDLRVAHFSFLSYRARPHHRDNPSHRHYRDHRNNDLRTHNTQETRRDGTQRRVSVRAHPVIDDPPIGWIEWLVRQLASRRAALRRRVFVRGHGDCLACIPPPDMMCVCVVSGVCVCLLLCCCLVVSFVFSSSPFPSPAVGRLG